MEGLFAVMSKEEFPSTSDGFESETDALLCAIDKMGGCDTKDIMSIDDAEERYDSLKAKYEESLRKSDDKWYIVWIEARNW